VLPLVPPGVPNSLSLPAQELPTKKRVLFVDEPPQLNVLTRSRALPRRETPIEETLPLTESPRPALPPERTAPLLPPDLKELFAKAYEVDKTPKSVLEALRKSLSRHPGITLAECEDRGGYLYYRDRLYVPDLPELHAELVRSYHESAIAGHMKRARTYEALSRDYYWPGMLTYVERWVSNCHTCTRITASREARQGVLRPLPIPERAWKDVSMDFITHLPMCEGYNAILVVVCRLTKMKHFIPCNDTCDAEEVARLYLKYIWKLHGLPTTVVSDRGP
jgi:hypothetical protein